MKRKLYLNTALSLVYQVFTVIIGLIIPRLILSSYGSGVNGFVQSITQMLSIISLLDLGVGAVVQASLYRPLAEKNEAEVSNIYSSAKNYFAVIAKILLIYILCLIFYYCIFKSEDFSWLYSATLIVAISISLFAQYYFGICNTLLLYADQKIYIPTLVNLGTLILNAVITVVLLSMHSSIQAVKLAASLIYIIRPLYLNYYVKRHYRINVIKNPPKNTIKQKWSGLAQHVSNHLTMSADSIILTLFSSFKTVSVYNVYVMPLNAIRTLMETTSSGYKSFFGNLIAKNDNKKLSYEFNCYEIIIHFIVTIIFSCVCILLVPFVLIYTQGIYDANYGNYTFSYLITLAYAVYSLRLPYTTIIIAAGRFRETQYYCVVECILNIALSMLLVKFIGISGVAIGTCISVGYRTLMSVYYLKNDILYRRLRTFIKLIIVDVLSVVFILYISHFFSFHVQSFMDWVVYAFIISSISICVSSLIFGLFYRQVFMKLINKVISLVKKGE
ncbi:MAG: sugar isomerase [Erysipelotrichaceae bacterium]|nr:sugar isomerase [Erysipelotrichaceae bacterium]